MKATIERTKSKRTYSLIGDETFRQMHAIMLALRSAAPAPRAASRGAEAVFAGTLVDLRESDLVIAAESLFPSALRLDGRLLLAGSTRRKSSQKQVPLITIGDTTGNTNGAVLTLGAGVALGRNTTAGESVVVAIHAATAASKTAWIEALRLAGKFRLPILFVLLQGKGDEAERIAAAIGSAAMDAGVIAVPVDSGDAVAMYRVAYESLARARRRTGATLIMSTKYQPGNLPKTRTEDPIRRMQRYLDGKGISSAIPTPAARRLPSTRLRSR